MCCSPFRMNPSCPITLNRWFPRSAYPGTYLRNNVFELEICVTVVLKVLAKVEILVPSYGYCEVPPCEEFADSVCDEFFSLPAFPADDLRRGFASRAERQLHVRQLHQLLRGWGGAVCDGWAWLCRRMRCGCKR